MENDIKNAIPGLTMGGVRAFISHPFEMMKIKSQIKHETNFYKGLFKGIHYSIGTNALERGIQFGLYEKFKLNDGNFFSSAKASFISTGITLPYNIILLRNVIMNSTMKVSHQILKKSMFLEYCRNLSGSILFLSTYGYLTEEDVPIFIRAPLTSCSVWLFTYPIDSYKNILLSNESFSKFTIKRLYKGIQYPLLRSFPSSIIGFYVYEYTKKIIQSSQ